MIWTTRLPRERFEDLLFLILGGNMSPHLFLIQKVKPERIANSGESKAEKENWVKSQTLFFSLDFFSAREESSG